jgi:peptide/nickel transport system ATP-binding protein
VSREPAHDSLRVPLVVTAVSKTYGESRLSQARRVEAVKDVSFTIEPGGALGLVGQSGSGKTTLARLVTGIERPTSGSIEFGSVQVAGLNRRKLRSYRRSVQMVFQDPYAALNPVHTVAYTVGRPAQNYLGLSGRALRDHVAETLELVGLTPFEQFAGKLPHQLSGGQRQRIVIAHALASRPSLIVADEPVSMLDVSLRAGILELLAGLRQQTGVSLLYITHDLLSARVATDQMLVLYHGQAVEHGITTDVLRHPQHDYTKRLLNAIPSPFAAEAPIRVGQATTPIATDAHH